MIKFVKTALLILIVISTTVLVACKETEFTFPTAESFVIEATVSGEYEYKATITESYAEFTGKYLTTPVRWQDGTVTCDGLTVNVNADENSLFRLSEMFSKLFSGEYESGEMTEKGERYEYRATVGGKEIRCEISKETKLPTSFVLEGNTVTVTNIELYRDTLNESYTQNMGDGRPVSRK